jgi:hypothetical protein
MRPDIKKDVFHLNWAPEAVPADDVCSLNFINFKICIHSRSLQLVV